MIAEILVPFIVFSAMFGALFIYLTTRNRERLAMIEKGANPSQFSFRIKRLGIKIGLLAMGVAIGILMGQMIAHLTNMDGEPASVSMVFLFAGLGLVVEHYLARKEAE